MGALRLEIFLLFLGGGAFSARILYRVSHGVGLVTCAGFVLADGVHFHKRNSNSLPACCQSAWT